jgi:hypothetical protein
MRRVLSLLLVMGLVLAACTTTTEDTTTSSSATASTVPTTVTPTTAPTTTTSEAPTTTTPPPETGQLVGLRPVEAFGDFPEIPLLGDDPAYAGPSTPTSLDGVLWADFLDYLPAEAFARLEANGFVVIDLGYGQFHEAYSHVDLTSRQPLFVTTDAAYHYWHLAFAKALRDTEQQVLLPILEDFARRLNEKAEGQAEELAGTSLADGANGILRYSELLLALLELDDGPYADEVTEEVGLVEDHLGFGESPTLETEVDYSLFRPRGHYTRTPELTRYFVAMSSLGQSGLHLGNPTQMRTALLLARLIAGDAELTRTWTAVYEPTAFLVGLADDFTPFEAAQAADNVDPSWQDAPEVIDDEFATAVAGELVTFRQVAIDPEKASVRVMGARFVLDSFILDQLVFPNVTKYDDDVAVGRFEASPLDVAAAFGSEWAYARQVEAGVPGEYPEYDPQLELMSSLVAGRSAADWAGTVYDGWLYAIQPSWSAHGAAYPDVMRTGAWAAKAHNTGFGSYTELKHDTVLYAKQAFAEGGAPDAPSEPRHWVEPEPVVYARLAAVAGLMADGLGDRDLLAADVGEILDRLVEMYGRFERLARDELAGAPISGEDNQWLETIGSRFELLWLLAAEDVDDPDAMTGGSTGSPNDVAALVVDIMSNPDQALELGTGYIDQILVLVPNDDGEFQVARGGVYSYYEFWVPRGERTTDEEWRQMLDAGTEPERPAWTEVFLVEQP